MEQMSCGLALIYLLYKAGFQGINILECTFLDKILEKMEIRKKVVCLLVYLLLVTFIGSKLCFANTLEGSNDSPKIERRFVAETLPLNLEELTRASDRIFTGNCVKVEELDDPESRLPVAKYTFRVIEGIKGISKKEISFKQWRPAVRDITFDKGKKYILFLYPNSERGLTSPVGLLQGHFQVDTKGLVRKKEYVRNKMNNRGLAKNLRTRKEINIGNNKFLNDYIRHCSENSSPIRYQEFIQAVKYLVENE